MIEATPVSFQIHPVLSVTSPVKVFVPVPPSVNVPVILDVPVTDNVKFDPVVNVAPAPIFRLPVIAKFATVVAVTFPVKVRLLTDVVAATNVFIPEPERMR